MVLFAPDGDEVVISTKDSPAELLLVGGVPLREPVARAGPFDEIALRQQGTDLVASVRLAESGGAGDHPGRVLRRVAGAAERCCLLASGQMQRAA